MKKIDPQVLLDNEIINKEIFDKIVEFTNTKKEEKNPAKKISIMMNVIAAVFAGMGLIWIVAANWNIIPGWLKIIFCMLLTLAALGYLIIGKNQNKNLEAASIFYIATLAVFIAIIGQVFNVSANLDLYFLTLIIFTGLLPFYTNSKLCEILYVAFTGMYTLIIPNIFEVINFTDGTFLTEYDWIGILLSMMIMFIIPYFTLRKEKINLLKFDNEKTKSYKNIYVSLVTLLIGLFLIEYSAIVEYNIVAPFMAVYVLCILTKLFNRDIQTMLYRIAIYVFLFIASIDGFGYSLDEEFTFMSFICLLVGVAIFAYELLNKLKCKNEYKKAISENINVTDSTNSQLEKQNEIKKLKKKFNIARIDTLVLGSAIFWPLFNLLFVITSWEELTDISEIFFLVYLLITSVILMKTGIKDKIAKYLYAGEILFAIEMLRLLFEVTDNLMLKGILSIVVAIIIVVVNKKTIKKNIN